MADTDKETRMRHGLFAGVLTLTPIFAVATTSCIDMDKLSVVANGREPGAFSVSEGGGAGGTMIYPESGPTAGCKKVDFLFVIDNSKSMGDNQAALIDSFPGFMKSIRRTLSNVDDYHFMVVGTDAAT